MHAPSAVIAMQRPAAAELRRFHVPYKCPHTVQLKAKGVSFNPVEAPGQAGPGMQHLASSCAKQHRLQWQLAGAGTGAS